MNIWKDIPGYIGLYQITRAGDVKSLRSGRLLIPSLKEDGYYEFGLTKNKKRKWFKRSRLVAITYIPNPYGYPEVNHKDEDSTNDDADNLEWCDSSYNKNYGTRNKRLSENMKLLHSQGIIKSTESNPVYQYTLDKKFVKKWPSTHSTQSQGTFSDRCVRDCCTGKQKQHKGYIWSYIKLH